MNSIWLKDYKNYNLKSISKDANTPVLIIGGGLAGIMCAYHFSKEKIDFILIESKKLGRGVTAGTTAQVTYAHSNLYDDIKKVQGLKKAKEYLQSQIEGFNIMKNIIKDENINCDYKEESTVIGASTEKGLKILNNTYDVVKDFNIVSPVLYKEDFIKNKKTLNFKNQFIVNSAKYINGIIDILIKNNSKIYEDSQATKINKIDNGYEVVINKKHIIKANTVVMACHYPPFNIANLYFTKIYQSKSYQMAFKTNLKLKANHVSLDKPYYYFRTYDKDTLIIGGSDHYTGINNDIKTCYKTLEDKIYQLDEKAVITHKWFTEDCIVIDSLPFVGHYSNNNKDMILVTGFAKWGFTNSHIAAKNVTNMLLNKKHDQLYKTNRYTLLKNLKSTGRMIAHSVDGLLLSKLCIKKENIEDIQIGSGKSLRSNNKNILVYRESEDDYIFLKNKCTHMGCSLIWKDVDKLWESKCHGSIFDRYGHVIYGPAINNLEILNFDKS